MHITAVLLVSLSVVSGRGSPVPGPSVTVCIRSCRDLAVLRGTDTASHRSSRPTCHQVDHTQAIHRPPRPLHAISRRSDCLCARFTMRYAPSLRHLNQHIAAAVECAINSAPYFCCARTLVTFSSSVGPSAGY